MSLLPLKLSSPDKIGVYLLDCFGTSVIAGFSGREYTKDIYPQFLADCRASKKFAILKQVHGADIVFVDGKTLPSPDFQADALITQTPGITLGIQTADCIPVFYWDPKHKAAGLAHAGWRGLHAGIVEKTLRQMNARFGTSANDLQIAFGPSNRLCCYEVGEEFASYFPEQYHTGYKGSAKGHVDLIARAAKVLTGEGVEEKNIFDTGICTACSNGRFFSARKENTENRILSILQITP